MRNLLTNETKKSLKSEYRLRLFTILSVFISAVLIMGDVFLLPSLLLSKSRKLAVENKEHLIEQGLALREADLSAETLRFDNSKVEVLYSLRNKIQFSERLRKIIENKPNGVSVKTFFYLQRDESEGSLILSGVADTREDLLSFEDVLKNEPGFTDVLLPVSNLAQDKDISFSVTIKGSI